MHQDIDIKTFSYPLPEERIARFPLEERDASKLLVFKDGTVSHTVFNRIGEQLPRHTLLVFNNTKVIRARLVFFKESGARIEIFCLEPHDPADYERAFANKGPCRWLCMVGNLRKWKQGELRTEFIHEGIRRTIRARRIGTVEKQHIVEFDWDDESLSFGQLLEMLGRIPIPPYLNRDSCEEDNTRYQTVYSKFEGSVAAPTAGLHFTGRLIGQLRQEGIRTDEVTLHVGAGTFLPVKSENAAEHIMHTEHFEITIETLQHIRENTGNIIAVGTTSVRTLESLSVLGYRVLTSGKADPERPIGQWEAYDIPSSLTGKEMTEALIGYLRESGEGKLKCATQIMITPGYRFRIVRGIITNFHQPQSTLLLLISALVGNRWKEIYEYALQHDFRFLSYGDSSLLLPDNFTQTDRTK